VKHPETEKRKKEEKNIWKCNAQIGKLWFLPYVPLVVLEEPDTDTLSNTV
jgi:hypothetical protein